MMAANIIILHIISLFLFFGTSILCDIDKQQFVTTPLRPDKSCSALNIFKCNSGQCIDISLACDGTKHCEDGSDEVGCSHAANTFTPIYRLLHPITKRAIRPTCVIPSINGTVYSNDQNTKLSHGTTVDMYTRVHVNCAEEYYKNSTEIVSTMICEEHGNWKPNYSNLCLTCGREFNKTKLLLENGTKELYGTFPWFTAIYKNNTRTNKYRFHCGGTLISLNVVVSAAHCFFDDDDYETIVMNINGRYKIAVGKFTNEIEVKDNRFTHILDLLVVFMNNAYNGDENKYANDIAVIVLQTPITISVAVSPICMNWKSTIDIPDEYWGKIAGWERKEEFGYFKPNLTEKPYKSQYNLSKCETELDSGWGNELLTSDKFCIQNNSVSSGVNSGSGFYYKYNNSHYLTGIGSVFIVKSVSNDDNYLMTFTKVHSHIDWIFKIYNYFKSNSYDLNEFICQQCAEYRLKNYDNLCLNNETSEITIFDQTIQPTAIDVDTPETTIFNQTVQPTETACGREFNETKLSVVNGTKELYGTSPWQIAIYKNNTDTNKYDLHCSGTLISLNLVVSAAHCFYDPHDYETIIMNINGRYKIAAGKFTNDIEVKDNQFTQILDLLVVFPNNKYYGYKTEYVNDIAVIVLQTKITVSMAVSPICMDWKSMFHIPDEFWGKVVGWGLADNSGPKLLEKRLKAQYTLPKCKLMLEQEPRKYVRQYHFCVQHSSDFGDVNSGAGFTYKYGSSHYLIGFASTSFINSKNKNHITLLMKVHPYIDWIFKIYYYFKNNSYNLNQFICLHCAEYRLENYDDLCSNVSTPKTTISNQTIQGTVIIRKN